MEVKFDKQNQNQFKQSKFYKILTWDNKLHSAFAMVAVNIFFLLYVVWDNTLLNLSCKAGLILMSYKLVFTLKKSGNENEQYDYEIMSEETIKELYVVAYVILNNAVQYLRDIIQLKD